MSAQTKSPKIKLEIAEILTALGIEQKGVNVHE